MRLIAFLAKSRVFIRPKRAQCISTFGYLSQEAHLADAPETPPPLPSNPATGSPMYQENWRSPLPVALAREGAVIPAGYAQQYVSSGHFMSGVQDAGSLIDQFADLMTGQEWDKITLYFELWVKMLDANGKPNKPDVNLYNHYLRANFMMGASAGDLLDIVAKMEDYGIMPNTASYNIVLKAMLKNKEAVAAEKLLERMILTGREHKDSLPDDESYEIVIGMLLSRRKLDSALKYIDAFLKAEYALKTTTFMDCLNLCVENGRLDTIVSIIERCKKMNLDKLILPTWRSCYHIADIAMQSSNATLAFYALEFLAKSMVRGERSLPLAMHYSVDEGLIVSALATAGRTYNSKLLDASWAVLKRSFREKKVSNPDSYLGKMYAHAKLGNLQKAFGALHELETVLGDSNSDVDDDLLSPFFSLNPLVLACSRNGFKTLDSVYYQLENLSQANPPFKSVSALNCIILGCANIWDVDRAYQTFTAIDATFGLTPNIHSYNALICAFGKLGKTDEAVKVYEHFLGLGVKPNATTYSLLVDAHLIKRDPKAALSVIDEMVHEGYEPSKQILKKIRRRCTREMDYESDDKVDSLAKTFKIRLGSETRRNLLFNLKYSMEYA